MKSAESGIHFHVQIVNRTFPEKGVLRFDHQISNAGGGMNLKSGVFTAPKAGIYFFSFSIAKDGYNVAAITVSLRLNKWKIGTSYVGGFGVGFGAAPTTIQATLKLKEGDQIDLLKSSSGAVDSSKEYTNHFTGWLLQVLDESE